MLRTTYSGFEVQAARGMNWEHYFSATRARLAAAESWPVDAFIDLLGELTRDLIDDGHLTLGVIRSTSPLATEGRSFSNRWHSYIRAGAEVGGAGRLQGCMGAAQQEILADQQLLLPSGKTTTADILQVRTPRDKADCGSETIPLREWTADMPDFDPIFEEKTLPTHDAYYVRMASLDPQSVETTAAFLKSAANAKLYRHVILQLRGGGNLQIVVNWIKALGMAGSINTALVQEVQSTGQLIATSFAALQIIAMLERNAGPEAAERLQQVRALQESVSADAKAAIAAGNTHNRTMKILDPGTNTDLGDGSFRGSLTVLVDEHCASACEFAVRLFKQIPGVRVLGSGTAGINAYTEPLQIMLPHSKVWYAVPTHLAFIGADGGPAEGRGVTPSIWAAGGDLLSQALATLDR